MDTKLTHKPLTTLTVVQVPYWGNSPVPGNDDAVHAFRKAKLYDDYGAEITYATTKADDAQMRYVDGPERLGIINGVICDVVAGSRRNGDFTLVVGGQCHHAPGVAGGLQRAHGGDARIGLVWLDAHGDFNTPKTTLSGSLGGMPVAVIAGLAYPDWREAAGLIAPIPTERIIHSDGRNLDVPERALMQATAMAMPPITPADNDSAFAKAVQVLAGRCDVLYLHIDEDILDARYVPSHGTIEGNGPSMEEVEAAIDCVMATGKVGACALVSVYCRIDDGEVDIESGKQLVKAMLKGWDTYGGV